MIQSILRDGLVLRESLDALQLSLTTNAGSTYHCFWHAPRPRKVVLLLNSKSMFFFLSPAVTRSAYTSIRNEHTFSITRKKTGSTGTSGCHRSYQSRTSSRSKHGCKQQNRRTNFNNDFTLRRQHDVQENGVIQETKLEAGMALNFHEEDWHLRRSAIKARILPRPCVNTRRQPPSCGYNQLPANRRSNVAISNSPRQRVGTCQPNGVITNWY